MYARLVSYSAPSENLIEEGIVNLQDIVAYCARVSNPNNQFNTKTARALIEYLLKHKHFSPLEMVSACIEIKTTRDIARQILRHRSFSFQEFSQRYADPTTDLEFEFREARMQDPNNRQNSIDTEDESLKIRWVEKQKSIIDNSKSVYAWAIKNGIAKEVARSVLPEGLMQSKLYMNGTLRSWLHYIQLRSENGTQKEHQEVAVACALQITKLFPTIWQHGRMEKDR